MVGQQLHQSSLRLLHRVQGLIDPGRNRPACHPSGKQHTAAKGTRDQQQRSLRQGAFRPITLGWHHAVHAQGQCQTSAIAALHGVAAKQRNGEWIEHGAHPSKRLKQPLLLQIRSSLRHGKQHLHAVQPRTTGPKVAAGMQRGETRVEPGIVQQSGKPIHALQHLLAINVGGHQRCILWPAERGSPLQPRQSVVQRTGGKLGRTTAASHRFSGIHGRSATNAGHKATINPVLPAPEPYRRPHAPRSVQSQRPGLCC